MPADNLSQNIRKLRQAAGETQKELGRALSVDNSTISRYEKGGDNDPGPQMLSNLAAHFFVTIDEMVMDRITMDEKEKVALNGITRAWMLKLIRHTFPVFQPEAEPDEHMQSALQYHQKIIEALLSESGPMEHWFTLAEEAYFQAETVEAAFNWLSLRFLHWFCTLTFWNPRYRQASRSFIQNLRKTKGQYVMLRHIHEYYRELLGPEMHDRLMIEYYDEYDDRREVLSIMRENGRKDLAYYYLALEYMIGMRGFKPSYIERGIGFMMDQSEIGNPYAVRLLDSFMKLGGMEGSAG
ncbi:MAG: helix-turn-helix transcriptional regulator [Firmicutes bacterium]|nr:helix-turn-helix transcriptional regulator [Bacillota bacterium]